MRWVQQAAIGPHRCAAIPFIGNSNAKGGFLDLQQQAREGDHLYLSREACEMVARACGWQPPHVAAHYKREIEAEKAENARQGGIIAEQEKDLEALRYTLRREFGEDVKVRAKPGRKPTTERVAA